MRAITFLKTALIAAALATGSCTHPPTPPSRTRCEDFQGKTLAGATLTQATRVAAHGTLPEYCQVMGSLPPALRFEVRMPTAWSGETVYVGGGGFDGFIVPGDSFTEKGHASIASNGGHDGHPLDGAFAQSPEQLEDFASQSVHRVLPVAKALLHEHYGRTSARTYFEGCSNGGREGLIAAERWPEDFDGIIAKAPAYDFVELMLTFHRTGQQLSQPGARPSGVKLSVLGKMLLAKCDAKDGLADGIIAHPDACHLDPAIIQCRGLDIPYCLTAPELASVRELASPYVLEGRTLSEGWPPGDVTDPGGWEAWMEEPDLAATTGGRLSRDFIRYFITQDARFEPSTFEPREWKPRIDALSARIDALDVKLERFRARGGKLILWHGGADGIVSQRGTTAYYERLRQAAGGQQAADTFVEYFPAPGVHHCGGGAGAGEVEFLPALKEWVEHGRPPSEAHLVATRRDAKGDRVLSRPLCKYPRYPRYTGSGDPALAESFTCVAP